MDEFLKILPLVRDLGLAGLALLFAYGLMREYIVPGASARRLQAEQEARHAAERAAWAAERDRLVSAQAEWKDMALRAIDHGERIASATDPKPRRRA